MAACNCGRTQGTREDPFDLRVNRVSYIDYTVEPVWTKTRSRMRKQVKGIVRQIRSASLTASLMVTKNR